MPLTIPLFIIACISYLVGSIPTSYWYALYFYNINLLHHGSRNPGATNCGRVLKSNTHFLVIMILDGLKSFGMLWIIKQYFSHVPFSMLTSSVFLLAGNSFSLFLHGKGGKGVSTYFGIIAALEPSLLLYFIPCWTIIKFISTSSALASTLSVGLLPGWYFFFYKNPDYFLAFFFTYAACWIILRHKQNFMDYLNQ